MSVARTPNVIERCLIMAKQKYRGIPFVLVALLLSCSPPNTRQTSDTDHLSPDSDWPHYGGSTDETHHSTDRNLDVSNVKRLGLAWHLDLPGETTLEATPLEIGGTLYFSGAGGTAYAVDAATGRLRWRFAPDTAVYDPAGIRISMRANRGVAFWRGKIYVGATDGRLFALRADTGVIVWKVDTFAGSDRRKNISGAPRVFDGKVVIGHGGDEFGTRGYLTAYDTETGKQLWRFYAVPGDPAEGFESPAMAMAAKTWTGEWWQWGGGGAIWDGLTYDRELHRLYIGTGNGAPWNARLRSPDGGDNLFLCSIVAVDADTGKYIWHYQTNPGETWDYKATENMVLADLPVSGSVRKVLMQASSNGFFYVLDRLTGKLVSAEKFSKANWASRIDLKNGRPVETANARYQEGPQDTWPDGGGAHNWQPMAYSPQTRLVYIPTMQAGVRLRAEPRGADVQLAHKHPERRFVILGTGAGPVLTPDPADDSAGLLAWDPVTQRKRWEVRYPDSYWNGGVLSTSGDLVFQGTGRGYLNAYDARTGERLWRYYAGLGIIGAPISYKSAGRQYIAILVGFGGAAGFGGKRVDYGWRYGEQTRRLLVFAIDGKASLPKMLSPRFTAKIVDVPGLKIDDAKAQNGGVLFNLSCLACHGGGAIATGSIAPDLRESAAALDYETFRTILKEGALASAGMPRYADLDEQEIRSIYLYIRKQARASLAGGHANSEDARIRY